MVDVLEQFLAEAGLNPSASRASAVGQFFAAEGVRSGPEFERIKALPRRRWQDDPELPELVKRLSASLRRPGSTAGDLFPVQAAALREAHDYRRLFLVASMGMGKTLITALLPTVLKAKRPVLMTYASLLESPHGPGKTQREFRKYAEDWKISTDFEFLSFEKFSRKEYSTWLDKRAPDLIIWDESHGGKNPKSGRTRRLGKYLNAHPECMFVPATGTPGDDSIQDYAHLLAWALGEVNCPLPTEYIEFVQWSQALDVGAEPRRLPGVLREFSGGLEDLDSIRAGVGRRIQETPGVIYARTGSCDSSLYLRNVLFDDPCTVMDFVRRSGDELPDGRILETPLEKWLLFETLNLGFARVIDPPPPKPWREARKLWAGFVSDQLSKPRSPYETPDQVKDACLQGLLDSGGVLEAWLEIKPSFKPVSRVEWFHEHGIKFLAELLAHDDVLMWVPFPALAEKLSAKTGVPYFHQRGFDSSGKYIEDHTGPAILSVKANATGRNLQKWSRNIIVGTPGTADLLCQLIARTHRTGQKAEAVEVTFVMASVENFESVYRARARAEMDRTVGNNQASALLTGDWLIYDWEDVNSLQGSRWKK